MPAGISQPETAQQHTEAQQTRPDRAFSTSFSPRPFYYILQSTTQTRYKRCLRRESLTPDCTTALTSAGVCPTTPHATVIAYCLHSTVSAPGRSPLQEADKHLSCSACKTAYGRKKLLRNPCSRYRQWQQKVLGTIYFAEADKGRTQLVPSAASK